METNPLLPEKIPFFEGQNRFVQIVIFLALTVACMVVSSVIGVIIASICYGVGLPANTSDQAAYYRIVQACNSVGTFLLPALLFSYLSELNCFSYNKMNKLPKYNMVNIVLVMSLAIVPVVAVLAEWCEGVQWPASLEGLEEWLRRLDERQQELVNLLMHDTRVSILLVNIFVLAILPALGEELLFRGTLQPFLQKWTKSPHWAIWITAMIFSAIHLQISGFIVRTLMGAYLGYLLYWSGSLWLPIIAHCLHNSWSILSEFIFLRRGYDVDNLNFTDIHNWQYLLGVSIILSVGGVYLLWRNRKVPANS